MHRLIQLGLMLSLLLMVTGLAPINTQAKSSAPQPSRSSAYDLIAAVNDLRASYGLPAYTINSILMQTAQSHAEYMASIGTVTHIGPGGSSITDRLIAAGYQMQGGYRAENILAGDPNASGWSLVTSPAWADADHQNTMLSSNLLEIGAGVAVSGGKGYYVIHCARPRGASVSYPPAATSVGSGRTGPTAVVVVQNTPNADGSIVHIVQKNDTIYGIAFAYGIPVEELLRLNGLTLDSVIYVGKQLIIRPAFTPTPTSPTSTPTRRYTPTPWLTSTATLTATNTALVATTAPKAAIPISTGLTSVSVIILLALVIAGAVAWLGSRGSK